MKKKSAYILILFLFLMFLFLTGNPAYADKPPWSGGPGGPKDQPPAAPEPFSLVLIGMGASGAAGYIIGRRKKKKD